jgi:hypothetical protein
VRDRLDAALDQAYAVFARYPRPPWLEGCGCCWPGEPSPNDPDRVVRFEPPGASVPLRAIPPEDLAEIAHDSTLIDPGRLGYRHYLPRIIEIALTDGFDWLDVPVVFARMVWSGVEREESWIDWPADEVQAVRGVIAAWWGWRLALPSETDVPGIDDVVCAVAAAVPDITPYLADWLRFEHPNAAPNLRAFLMEHAHARTHGRLVDGWWSHWATTCDNAERVVAWAKAESTLTAVLAAADRARTPEERDALEDCFLRWLG